MLIFSTLPLYTLKIRVFNTSVCVQSAARGLTGKCCTGLKAAPDMVLCACEMSKNVWCDMLFARLSVTLYFLCACTLYVGSREVVRIYNIYNKV